MGKMIIKLPAIRKSMRKRGVSSAEEQGNKKTSSERVRKYRQKLKTDPKLRQKNEESKLKKKAENKAYKSKIKELREQNESFNNAFKQKQKLWKKNSRERKAEKNKEQTKETSTVTEKSSNMKGSNKPSTIRKRAQRVKKILPDSSVGWASTMKHLINNATPKRKSLLDVLSERSPSSSEDTRTLEINKIGRPKKSNEKVKKQLAFSEKPDTLWKKQKTLNQYKSRKLIQVKRLSKAKAFRENWNSKLETFLYANSRVMPNKKDAIKIAGNYVPKYHLLCSKKQLFAKFKKEHPTFGRQLSTFLKMIPKNFRSLDLRCRRVCVCTKDYNIDQKIEVLNKAASQKSLDLKATSRQLSTMTLCPYEGTPNRKCVDRVCENCGTQAIYQLYQPLLESFSDDQIFKYHQWETRTETVGKGKKRISRWVQVEKKSSIKELVDEVASCLEVFTGHLFRADFQHKVYTTLTSNLLIDQAVVVMDFSENIALEQQDQIESAHWTVQQVTLHPIFLVRHAAESTEENPIIMKESLIILSNDLTHNSGTVYVFTEQLLLHIKNNPGPCPIKVLHRFSDNCAAQYKSKLAFDHLIKLEEKHGIQIIYHYTESGHGKGPSDGLGAAIKKKLERMILGGKVINNAYQTYLALVQNQNENLNQKIIYIPDKKLQNSIPSKSKLSKTIKGTQSFHMVYQLRPRSGVLVCDDLSCSCDICIGKQTGPCFFSQFRHDHQYFNLMTGRKLSSQMLNVNEVTLCILLCMIIKIIRRKQKYVYFRDVIWTKPTKCPVHLAKTQISLCIHPVNALIKVGGCTGWVVYATSLVYHNVAHLCEKCTWNNFLINCTSFDSLAFWFEANQLLLYYSNSFKFKKKYFSGFYSVRILNVNSLGYFLQLGFKCWIFLITTLSA